MFPVGFFLVALAGYLLDCAIKNRPPIGTLEQIIQNPAGTRDILSSTEGTGYLPATGAVSSSYGFDSGTGTDGKQALSGLLGLDSTDQATMTNPAAAAGSTGAASEAALKAVELAETAIGKPYRWGATGPNAFDCSGLCYWAYKHAGVNIPRTTATQQAGLKKVSRANLLPGDLIFPTPTHVMMYVGNGTCVEAPHTGENVKYSKIYSFYTARRVR